MKILLVDDEAGALRDLLRVMEKAAPDDEIVTARESKAALSLCGEQRFDAVFLDIKMPDMDGLTLTSEIKRICPMTNIIIVTAYPGALKSAASGQRYKEGALCPVLRAI